MTRSNRCRACGCRGRGSPLVDDTNGLETVLGGMLIAQWPTDSLWAIGLFFGIGLAFSAVNLITAPDAPVS